MLEEEDINAVINRTFFSSFCVNAFLVIKGSDDDTDNKELEEQEYTNILDSTYSKDLYNIAYFLIYS